MTPSDTTTTDPGRTLRDIDLPQVVDTARHDLRTEFYDPVLSTATSYDRAVGFFSTTWFQEVATGIAGLVANEGTARWIISPVLSPADAEALHDGYAADGMEQGSLMDILRPQLAELEDRLAVDTRNTVGWLIAERYIKIRIAIPTEADALFHDKVGIVEDGAGNRLSFHGSQNDSGRAFRNHEAYTIDCSWRGDADCETVADHAARFERLWTGKAAGVSTISLPEAAERELLELRSTGVPPYRSPTSDGGVPTTLDDDPDVSGDAAAPLRETVTLRPYQEDALDAWKDNGYRGIVEMATGLGKTITAMAAIDAYREALADDLLVVVAVPETYLGRQWAKELAEWGFDDPLMAYGSANHAWAEELSALVTNTELGITTPGIAITSHDTFHKERFRQHIERAQVPSMLIVDEVHGAGTDTRVQGLDAAYDARLGLSATPERYMDPEGTAALTDYFEGSVFEYGLADGIPEYLAEYEYYPRVVELSDEEAAEYTEESQSLAAAIGSDEASESDIQRIAQQRAEISKTATGKLAALNAVLEEMPAQEDLLVFAHHEQIDTVTDVLYEHDVTYHRYTQSEGPTERERLLESFAQADEGLDALVGIHCLDEGVDVSSAQTAVLLSSTGNPRQFVQRRGRVLRQHESKDVARIYDFIVIPPRDRLEDLLDSERRLIRTQLDRHEEFAQTAINADEARATVRELREALED